MHIHSYVAMLYTHKRIISHPDRIWFFCTVLSHILFIWQHTSAFQMSKQASSQLGSTDAEHLVRSVGLEGPGQGGSVAPQCQQEQASIPLGWDPTWNGNLPRSCTLPGEHILVEQWPRKPTNSYVRAGHIIYFRRWQMAPALFPIPF